MLDLSPFKIDSIKRGDRMLIASPPFVFTPRLSLDQVPFIDVHEPEFSVFVYARTRERLQKELEEQLWFLWDEYAKADNATMTKKTIVVAQRLRARIKEVELMFRAVGDSSGSGFGNGREEVFPLSSGFGDGNLVELFYAYGNYYGDGYGSGRCGAFSNVNYSWDTPMLLKRNKSEGLTNLKLHYVCDQKPIMTQVSKSCPCNDKVNFFRPIASETQEEYVFDGYRHGYALQSSSGDGYSIELYATGVGFGYDRTNSSGSYGCGYSTETCDLTGDGYGDGFDVPDVVNRRLG